MFCSRFCRTSKLVVLVATSCYLFTLYELMHRAVDYYQLQQQAELDRLEEGERMRNETIVLLKERLEKEQKQNVTTCSRYPKELLDSPFINVRKQIKLSSEEAIVRAHPDLLRGGYWYPTECKAASRVAIIIPYRDRHEHLLVLLYYLIPLLKRQLLNFRIFVSEQEGTALFNKGRLMNAAFDVATNTYAGSFDCVIFHDVDLLPQVATNLYECPSQPKHMSAYVDALGYRYMYDYLAGGVFAISVTHFKLINGYSNEFWGWGGEDDDVGQRVYWSGLKLLRANISEGRYRMLPHAKRNTTNARLLLKVQSQMLPRLRTDGLNSANGSYAVRTIDERPLYTRILVDVGRTPWLWLWTEGKPQGSSSDTGTEGR